MVQKKFRPKKNLGLNKFWLERNFGLKKFWVQKKIRGPTKIFGLKKNIDFKKFWAWKSFGSKTNFGSEKNLGLKKNWVRKKSGAKKKFGLEKILSSKKFVVVLVLLVTWTPNPINSAKSPWVIYTSNFSFLVHPSLIDFGEGCSCDRGKTKSTLSLKT